MPKPETRSFTLSTGNSLSSSSMISALLETKSSLARASSNSYSNFDSSAFFLSSKTTVRRSASRERVLAQARAFSACNFFLKIELLLDLDELVDPLDVNNTGVCSLDSLFPLICVETGTSTDYSTVESCYC